MYFLLTAHLDPAHLDPNATFLGGAQWLVSCCTVSSGSHRAGAGRIPVPRTCALGGAAGSSRAEAIVVQFMPRTRETLGS